MIQRRKNSWVTLISVLVFLLIGLPIAADEPWTAQDDKSDWNNLRQLRIRDKVELVRMNLSKQKGTVLAWTEEAISLLVKGRDVTIPREDVYRVTWLSKSHRARNAWRGMALGAAVGALIGAVSANQGTLIRGANTAAGALLGAGAGAGVGAAFPSHPTLYRAPRGTD